VLWKDAACSIFISSRLLLSRRRNRIFGGRGHLAYAGPLEEKVGPLEQLEGHLAYKTGHLGKQFSKSAVLTRPYACVDGCLYSLFFNYFYSGRFRKSVN